MKYTGKIATFLILLFAALFPITGSTIMNSEDIRARLIFEAYRRAFPDRIDSIEYRNEEWTAVIDGDRFYWARGRILPEADRGRWTLYRPYVFYTYPDQLRDPRSLSPEQIAKLRAQGEAEARLTGVDHHPAFRAALYGSSSRGGAEKRLAKTTLFGKRVNVHGRIVDALGKVDRAVREAAESDQEVAAFLNGIGSIGGYNWREIRGTSRRSFHSWGLAVDIQPARLGGKITFWEWERERNPDWMLAPLERRWMPPKKVVQAFEKEGFAWGGKWDFYDTMHFEYRPELHEMKKVLASVSEAREFSESAADLAGFERSREEPAAR